MKEREEENEDKPWIWEEWRQGQEGNHFAIDDEKDVVKDCDDEDCDNYSQEDWNYQSEWHEWPEWPHWEEWPEYADWTE